MMPLTGQAVKHPSVFQYYGRTISLFHSLGVVPFKWDEKQQNLVIPEQRIDPFKRGSWKWAVATIVWSHLLFMILQSVRMMLYSEDLNLIKGLLYAQQTARHCVIFYLGFNVVVNHPAQVPTILNNIQLLCAGKGNKVRQSSVTVRRLLYAVRVMMVCIPTAAAIPILWKPQNPWYMTSLLDRFIGCSLPVKMLFGLYHGYAHAVILLLILTIVSTAVVSCDAISRATQEIMCNDDECASVRARAHAAINTARSMAVAMQMYNACFKQWNIVFEVSILCGIVLHSSEAIKYLELRSAVIALSMIVTSMYLYGAMGKVYESSKDAFVSWKWVVAEPYFLRRCKALRPYRVQLGEFFFADKGLCLTFMSTAAVNTASLVLSTA